jgi:hypothetical protein
MARITRKQQIDALRLLASGQHDERAIATAVGICVSTVYKLARTKLDDYMAWLRKIKGEST